MANRSNCLPLIYASVDSDLRSEVKPGVWLSSTCSLSQVGVRKFTGDVAGGWHLGWLGHLELLDHRKGGENAGLP